MTKNQARALLKDYNLRATGPRVAVVRVLAQAEMPLSNGEVLQRLGETDWDPATIYRNLVKLRETGVATVVSRAEGIDRYVLTAAGQQEHHHPHFICEDCGRVACLPEELIAWMKVQGRWSDSVRRAMVQLQGECPDCLAPTGSQ